MCLQQMKLLGGFVIFNFFLVLRSCHGAQSPLQVSNASEVTGIDKYGNWCGGGHGGLQDCCNGGKCPSCNQGSGPTPACLNECPPIDAVDRACVDHDFCCFNNPKSISCSPEGNYCKCDCQLVKVTSQSGICGGAHCSAYVFSLNTIFKDALACFTYTSSGQQCVKPPHGNDLFNYC